MATSNLLGVSPQSFVAGATIGQYRAVKLDTTANTVIVTAAIADLPIGVAMISGVAGENIPVQQFGKAKCVASAAVSIGDELMATASGAGKVSTLAGATARGIGVALTAATTDGDIIEVQLGAPALKSPVGS